MQENFCDMIFKRKSFHLFRGIGKEKVTEEEMKDIKAFWESLTPLYPDIQTAMQIVPESEVTNQQGQEYCIAMYSEKKDGYLQNIGYLGQMMDLYLVSKNIGTCWYGIGKAKEERFRGLDYVIMIAFAKVDDAKKFRKDMFKAKRKPVTEAWIGEPIEGVTDIARFAPSACNTQPWVVEHVENILNVYRYRKPGKLGIMPADKVSWYNRIDMGIYLCILEVCLQHQGIAYSMELHTDPGADAEKTLNAVITIQ